MMDAEPGAGAPDHEHQRALRRLVSSLRARGGVGALGAACHRDVPGVDGVVLAVFAAHAGRIIMSDSGPAGDQFEDMHATLGEGPGIDAAITGQPVTAVDLDHTTAHTSWPRFAGRAVACRDPGSVRRPRPAARPAGRRAESLPRHRGTVERCRARTARPVHPRRHGPAPRPPARHQRRGDQASRCRSRPARCSKPSASSWSTPASTPPPRCTGCAATPIKAHDRCAT